MKLTVVFEDENSVVGKNEQGTLFIRTPLNGEPKLFRPITSFDVRHDLDGELELAGYQELDPGQFT